MSDIFKQFITSNVGNQKDSRLLDIVEKLVDILGTITEFNTSELMAISVLQTDKYYTEILDFYIRNKKHIKRKHAKEILEALNKISLNLGNNNVPEV